MNEVLSWPAWKSGSLRIFRWSGTVVLIPSMTVISSVRRMRAIASLAVAAVHDDLGDHRVVVRRHGALGVRERIDAHARTARHVERVDDAGRRREGLGILGVDAALDRVAGERDVALLERRAARPAAIRICSFTMSMPVTISVTGCSTWRRVFISMK